jgi:hypothetical protein
MPVIMKKIIRIAVIGTVGAPARYGGFETLVEQLAIRVNSETTQLVIYCQKSAYPEISIGSDSRFAGHDRIFLPIRANGLCSLLHDVVAMIHAALIARADVMLILGYSGAWAIPIMRFLRPKVRILTNIDGMEWRRGKFGVFSRFFLRFLEFLAVKFSSRVIVDNAALEYFAQKRYSITPRLIAYGGDHTVVAASSSKNIKRDYYLSISRIEPENNCGLILSACAAKRVSLVYIGNWQASRYGRDLRERYTSETLRLLDPVYDLLYLAAVRAGAVGYIHGHSVGGTNPSLVEALYHTQKIYAFDCVFNRETLSGFGAYFKSANDLFGLLECQEATNINDHQIKTLRERYQWSKVVEAYQEEFRPVDY